jgi:phosphate starvation-inducible PhoH-like protein
MARKTKQIKDINLLENEENNTIEIEIPKNKFKIKQPFKLTEKQVELVKVIQNENSKIIFIESPSGCGKTYVAVLGALQLLNLNSSFDQIIYLRSIIEAGNKSLGALPGTIEEKTNAFAAPLWDKLDQLLNLSDIKKLTTEKYIEFSPINFLRGADWKNKIIILDEAQNLSFHEIETVLTRVGAGSKLIICGDSRQSDIGYKSGFEKIMQHFESHIESAKWGLEFFRFTTNDIVRAPFLKFIIEEMDKIKLNF